jgi:DNA-binding transcriptional ArsR family regulator
MLPWDKAPITKAALWTSEDEQGPPPIEREWHGLVNHDQDVILLWGGAWNRGGRRLGWTWIGWAVAEDDESSGEPSHVTETPAANVERMLAPLAHESRIRILQTLYRAPKSSGELSEATGLKGGNLYYHLKELMHAAYVAANDFSYEITPLGCQMLITVTSIAGKLVADRGEQGLMVTSGWERGEVEGPA